MKKIRITHDGSMDVVNGTKITDAQTSESIEWVSRAEITLDAAHGPQATLYIANPQLSLVVDAEIRHTLDYDPTDIDSIDQAITFLQGQRAERTQQ
jgi:hypothetical protein